MSSLKEIQNKSLEMAEYFVEFCREHDLLCYLCGGGAIGGLRNKGFIPWDDDLDFLCQEKIMKNYLNYGINMLKRVLFI